MAKRDVDAVGGKRAGGALRPFDQGDRAIGQRRKADLFQFGGIVDAV